MKGGRIMDLEIKLKFLLVILTGTILAMLVACGPATVQEAMKDRIPKQIPQGAKIIEVIPIAVPQLGLYYKYWYIFKFHDDCFLMKGIGHSAIMANISCPKEK